MKNFCILLPAPLPTGPIKGAYALANSLAKSPNLKVFIIFLKRGSGVNSFLDKRVKLINLDTNKATLITKLFAYRTFLNNLGDKNNITSLSMCFSADLVNAIASPNCFSIISIRGNLIKNYFYEYGFFGIPLAFMHYRLIPFVDKVIAMTKEMKNQIKFFSMRDSIIIPNFIDEKYLERFRVSFSKKDQFDICFVGNLSTRKQPLFLIKTFLKMNLKNSYLHIIGDGPLIKKIKKFKNKYDHKNKVILHGQLENPYKTIANSDLFILPSLAEGIARASLEALFFGTPCILRAVDGNEKLFNEINKTGTTFKKNNELEYAIRKMINSKRVNKSKYSLIPSEYSQSKCSNKLIEIIKINGK